MLIVTVIGMAAPYAVDITFAEFRNHGWTWVFDGPFSSEIRDECERLRGLLESVVDSDRSVGPPLVTLCFSPDAEETISRLDPALAATGQRYVVDRGSGGMAGGRTLSRPEGVVVVIDMGWLVDGEPDPSASQPGRVRAIVNRSGADLLTHTVIHEGYHVLAHQRGTNFEVWGGAPERTGGWAEQLFRYCSTLLVDECRTERAAHFRDPRPDDSTDWGSALSSLGKDLRTAVSDYQRHLDIRVLAGQVVGGVAGPFWVSTLGYAVGRRSAAPAYMELWGRYVGPCWSDLVDALESVPPPEAAATSETLAALSDAQQRLATKVLPELLSATVSNSTTSQTTRSFESAVLTSLPDGRISSGRRGGCWGVPR